MTNTPPEPAAKVVRARTPKPSDDNLYRVHIEMGASEYVGKGETLVDAFANLDTIVNYKQRAAIVMTHGNKRATAFAHPVVMRRIAESKMFRITWTKLYARALA